VRQCTPVKSLLVAPLGVGVMSAFHCVPFQRTASRFDVLGVSAVPTAKQLAVVAHETAARCPYCAPAIGPTTVHDGAALAGDAVANSNATTNAIGNTIGLASTAIGVPPALRLRIPDTRPRVTSRITIETSRADITLEAVDAIVNAANATLRRGGGVCGAIFAAAGPELDVACGAIGSCETGDAVITPGFHLAARWIVHTVGPVWHGGTQGEAGLLASCYRRSIEVARDAGAASIAFPAVSTGIFGYPAQAAAEIAVATVREHEDQLGLIRLIAFDEPTFTTYRELLSGAAS
jgi:O-acetyl-ADP-ribose deacetylase